MIQRMFDINKFQRDNQTGGLILGESADTNMYVTVSAGSIWSKLTKTAFAVFDSDPGGGADTFDTYKHVSGTFTLTTGVTQWPNTQYDDGTDLVTMGSNKYANLWFYGEPDGEVAMVYGVAQYTQSALAELEEPPSALPIRIQTHSFLLGRLTFKKSATTATQVDSVFETVFLATQAATHSNLSGLTVDADHPQYTLIDGTRAFSGNISHGGFNITNVGTVAGTLTTAAQTNVTSLGTLTILQVDNISINGNTISSTAGTDLLITPLGGQQLILDGAVIIDAGVVTGVSTLTMSSYLQGTTGNGYLDLRGDSGASSGLRIDDSGNVLIGTTTDAGHLLHLAAESDESFSLLVADDVDNFNIKIRRSRGALASKAAIVDGDLIGGIAFQPWDGNSYRNAALIRVKVDGAVADNQVGGELLFYTAGSDDYGGALRMSISSLGAFDFKTGTTKFNTVTYTWPGSDGGSGDLLTTNGTGGLSWTAGGGGGIGGSGTAGKIAKWTAGSTLDDSIMSDDGSIITITGGLDLSDEIDLNNNNIIAGGTITATTLTGTLSTAAQANITSVGTLTSLDMAGQIDMNGNNLIAGAGASFTQITASTGLIQGSSSSTMILSGGTGVSNGATIVLYGESHGSKDGDFEFRDNTTVKLWYDSSQSVFQVNGNLKITSNIGFFDTTPLSKQTITGSRDNNPALTSLLTALAAYGLLVDSSSV
jgi:hypothetical protein